MEEFIRNRLESVKHLVPDRLLQPFQHLNQQTNRRHQPWEGETTASSIYDAMDDDEV